MGESFDKWNDWSRILIPSDSKGGPKPLGCPQLINLRRQDEVALGQAVDLVRVEVDRHASPREVDDGVMVLPLGDLADAVDERQRTDEVLELEGPRQVVLVNDVPVAQLFVKIAEFLALQRRHATGAGNAFPVGQAACFHLGTLSSSLSVSILQTNLLAT